MPDSFLIFLIDDDAASLEQIKTFINTKYGDANIEAFTSGEKALMELHRKPDVIILDYHIYSKDTANMSSLEILKRITQLLPHTPVIFLSDADSPEIAENIIKYGAFDYIVRNDHAFNRLEIMIDNATGHLSLHKQIRTQKIFNIILILLIVALLLAFVTKMLE
jgi:DNA-binding NarL/FixJ family response regulator